MLDLTIVRGPLQSHQNEEILREVNRLTNSHIELKDFCRWVQDSPDGPAFHALLNSGQRIVGHFSLIPLRASLNGEQIPAARTEYFFVHEEFRREKVRGFEGSFFPPAILLLDQLYRHCRSSGWGPFLVSAGEEILPFHELVGCRPMEIALHECLFVLRSWQAARRTPNIGQAQRAGLLGIGMAQSSVWTVVASAFARWRSIKCIPVDQVPVPGEVAGVELFQDQPSRVWRYPEPDYLVFCCASNPSSYVIAKNGSEDRYLRVCQWCLGSSDLASSFIHALLRHAQLSGALGVRWSVYENGEKTEELLRTLRNHGFLSAARVRRLLLYAGDGVFCNSSTWRLSDSLFCFDL